MRGGITTMLLYYIMFIFVTAGVAGLLAHTYVKISQFIYVVYDFYLAHRIVAQGDFGLIDESVQLPDLEGMENVGLLVYDLEKGKVIHSTGKLPSDIEELAGELANRTPSSPILNVDPGEDSWLSAFALPTRVRHGGRIRPALLIVLSENKPFEDTAKELMGYAMRSVGKYIEGMGDG